MSILDRLGRWDIVSYSSYLTYTPKSGEIIYFNSVITGQVGLAAVMGDGTTAVSGLPFMDELVINSSSNVDLEDLRTTGNKARIYNSGSSTIEIEIGISGSSRIFYLLPNKDASFFYNGAKWIHEKENVITMTDADLVIVDVTGPTRVIMPSSGITANRTVTLPTLADNQNQVIRFDNLNTSYALFIDGEGAETIEGFDTINLSTEYTILEGNSSEWKRIGYEPNRPVYHYRDEKAAGTDGGGSTATTWTKRTCDDLVLNQIIGASQASSVHTLPPGTYEILCTSPFYRVGQLKLKLRNTTDGSDTAISTNDYCNTTNGAATITIEDRFTITASKNFEVQYHVASAVASNGLGVTGIGSVIDIYTDLIFTKLI